MFSSFHTRWWGKSWIVESKQNNTLYKLVGEIALKRRSGKHRSRKEDTCRVRRYIEPLLPTPLPPPHTQKRSLDLSTFPRPKRCSVSTPFQCLPISPPQNLPLLLPSQHPLSSIWTQVSGQEFGKNHTQWSVLNFCTGYTQKDLFLRETYRHSSEVEHTWKATETWKLNAIGVFLSLKRTLSISTVSLANINIIWLWLWILLL